MPADGMQWLPKEALMTAEEIRRIVSLGIERLGVRELRITGGEPLLRPDLVDIIAAVRERLPQLPISMTTNGVGLEKKARAFKEAGLTRVNVSLDSLHEDVFTQLTRSPFLGNVLAGVEEARAVGPWTGQNQRCADARGQRPRSPGAVGMGIIAELRTALHRTNAAGRRTRLD